ncbi:virulence factor Mce family protein [Mycobacterium sp. SMC-2]|uniref:virulence factor Mce family protein n=1 Tax=Mycobacterium TaxID=1763 RepID=UPI001CE0B3A9|nr:MULTISPECIES: virulence factor Mce family protein [Mycobacterium]MCA4761218.1 virulence factor Mce family protein [Mycobacterium avium subsp. hominissuis]UXA06341.1 virulence factor Mce family protein [Mycobacterium sp. SMC-2]
MSSRNAKIGVAIALVVVLIGGIITVLRSAAGIGRTTVVGYFANSTGLYNGDSVVVLGVPVGKIEKIEPQPNDVKITFWYNDKYKVPADAKAVILSPSLVTPRSIQLTPAYTGGRVMADHAVIPQERTAVPVEYDDFRQQLEKLTQVLQPTTPGGTSTLGAFINTAADNLRGQGPDIRDTVIKLSQAISALGDHSNDLFSTVKNLSILVSALHDSSDLLQHLNQNLAAVTGLLANDPDEVAHAVRNLNDVVDDVRSFVADNREALGTTSDKLASVTQAVNESLDDVKQLLHVGPTAFQNFLNIYQPAQGTLTGALALNNFANTIQFLCGAVQAASRRGAKESAKLCVQYLAPIIKNRQMNFPPLGENLFVGAAARPNELTYSEDWLRPDYVPPPPPGSPPAPASPAPPADETPPAGTPPPAADASTQPPPAQAAPTNPAAGLRGMMVPPGGGQ